MPASPELRPDRPSRPEPGPPHPPLPVWSRVWRYLAAAGVGAAAWTAQAAAWLSMPLPDAREDVVGAALFVDLLLGGLVLAVLPLRRRHPLAVAWVTTATSVVSVAGLGAASLALVSMATWRRRGWVIAVAAVFLPCWVASEILYRPRFAPADDGVYPVVGGIVAGLIFLAVTTVTGFYIAARRELVTALHDRVRTVERERVLTAAVARDAERTRIAREMHDVLAHRISLVALHAGVLSYRADLSRAQTSETAAVIQANAQLALTELRQVLGVLRTGADGLEPPQPTLAELPALLAEAREAGADIRLDATHLQGGPELEPAGMSETLSRAAFRIIQEALTNARKHAPGEAIDVTLRGAPGTHLDLEIRNPLSARADAGSGWPGMGLLGLNERADLAGGVLEHGPQADGSFAVRARLPWPSR